MPKQKKGISGSWYNGYQVLVWIVAYVHAVGEKHESSATLRCFASSTDSLSCHSLVEKSMSEWLRGKTNICSYESWYFHTHPWQELKLKDNMRNQRWLIIFWLLRWLFRSIYYDWFSKYTGLVKMFVCLLSREFT